MPRDPALNPSDDRVRLTHMLEWARKAVRFCEGRSPADFEREELLLPAVLRAIETIREAPTKVSEHTRSRVPGIDW